MLLTEDVRTIRDLIDYQAEARPGCAFLLSPETGQRLTFQQLRDQVRQLCGLLQSLGMAQGDKVAFLMDNGLFTAQLFLATMYGGFVTVPLNVRAGVSQLAYTLETSDAKLVFVGRPYETLLQEVLGQVRRFVEIVPAGADSGPAMSMPDFSDAWPRPGADDAAMLIYTSGSTGQPKGPIHTHRSVLAHGRNSIQAHELTAADRSLLVLPLYHINAECVTLVPTLLSGGSVVLPHGFTVSEFWNWIDDYRCTWTAVVPTIISQLLDWQDPKADQRAEAFARIRFLRSSSAPLSPSLHREFIDKFQLPLIQAMGSSEAGNVFSNPVPPGVNKIGSPGLPWGFEARIVDRDGADLPAGEPGEVWLRGEGMTQGYYKDPAATAAAFDAQGWLHTGDLAYRDADGYFFVIGRSKELIIKGGVNIAPKQIDEILEAHPAVLEAAAVGVPDRYVGEDLVAFAVLRHDMRCDELELLSFCESHLGYFKTPTRVYFVADLPKGPSGKVQRLRLVEEAERLAVASAPPLEEEAGAADFAASDREGLAFERFIAEIWAELLTARPSGQQIGPQSNFFALGGQSLQAIQCLSRLRERTQILLSLADFFENATVAELASLVRRRRAHHQAAREGSDQSQDDLQPIPVRDSSLPCPLSPAQERIWFMEQVKAEEPAYNEAEAVRLKGPLDVAALERAFNIVIGRHEILRTTIEARDGKPGMIIHESFPIRFKTISLIHLEPSQRDAELTRLLSDEPRRPYRLEMEPAVRMTIVEMGEADHAIIVMMHHIICDSGSLGILWRELAALYPACLKGEESPLAPLPIQYGDYAVWQNQPRQQAQFAEDLAFWKETLRDAPPLLDQPTDWPRPPVFSYRGIKQLFTFDAALTDELRDLCRRHQSSLFTVFAATLNTIMHRYTGQDDILVGIPIAARERPELRPLIGFLIDTHVLRTNLSGDPTFRELMTDVQQNVAYVYSHRAVPFDQVVSALHPERNLGYSPVIQMLLNWRDRDDQPQFIGLPGMATEALLAQPKIAKFDLTLTLTDTGREIALEVEYNTDLFSQARIGRLVGHMQTLLQSVAANVEQRLSALPLLSAPERDQLLDTWNATHAIFPADRCIHELFETQAARTPDSMAVAFGGSSLSYGALNRRADELAGQLRALGVGPDVLVALFLERSLDMVVGMLAVLKAGGAYVPLDPAHPPARLAYMLEDAQPLLLLTQKRLQPDLPPHRAQLLLIDGAAPLVPAPAAGPRPEPGHLAYVIYTSGSTGQPKGVEIEHRAVVNMLAAMQQRPGLAETDRMLAITTLTFDIAVLEIFLPLVCGACVVIAPSATAGDGVALAGLIAESGVSVMQATPATLRMLLQAGWGGAPGLKILCGGEAYTEELAGQMLARCGTLWNMYGPTETTVWSAVSQVKAGRPVTMGPPIANTRFYVLDRALQLVPVGVPGELYIGGAGLARGYRRRPDLTAARFVTDPFAAAHSGLMYRTGDLVRRLPDGTIEFLGRLDHQVKIRGFRIELGEIEAQLREHAAIRDVVVIAREDTPGDKNLVAYVVADQDEQLAGSLRAHVATRLPKYMVPSAFVRLDAFPLTPNGKLDRKALPAPEADAYLIRAYEAPSNDAEAKTAEIWQEVLGLPRIGRDDNFFDLGGNSLRLMTVAGRLKRVFGKPVAVLDLFQYTTVRTLAQYMAGEVEAFHLDHVPIQIRPRKDAMQRQRQRQLRQGIATEI